MATRSAVAGSRGRRMSRPPMCSPGRAGRDEDPAGGLRRQRATAVAGSARSTGIAVGAGPAVWTGADGNLAWRAPKSSRDRQTRRGRPRRSTITAPETGQDIDAIPTGYENRTARRMTSRDRVVGRGHGPWCRDTDRSHREYPHVPVRRTVRKRTTARRFCTTAREPSPGLPPATTTRQELPTRIDSPGTRRWCPRDLL